MEPKKLAFIDSLRGLAALYVLVFHLSLITSPKAVPPSWLAPIIGGGGGAVMLFFIVSAFTLCLSMESRATGGIEPLAHFYVRRFFRIAPLFYTWLVIYYVRDMWYYNVDHSAVTVAQSALFIFNLIPGQETGYVWASWTIGAEMLFYAIFPLIFFHARNLGIAIAMMLIAMMLRVPLHALTSRALDPAIGEAFYIYSLVFNLGIFLAGIVVYHIHKLIDRDKADRYGAGYSLVALFAAILVWDVYCPQGFTRTTQVFLQTIFFSALTLGLAITPVKLFVNRITQFYGKISYSVYLSHATTVFFMSPLFAWFYKITPYKTLAFGASVASALAVVTPISYLTYRYIEAPANAYGHSLILRRAARPRKLTPVPKTWGVALAVSKQVQGALPLGTPPRPKALEPGPGR
jgi:peptidoglycan/LPS O-acetylase OafA/YrhL